VAVCARMMRVASEGVIMEAMGSRSSCDPDGREADGVQGMRMAALK
jgi:hypothetical protein